MVVHPNLPPRHQGPNLLPTNFCSQGPHRRPCSQPQARPQTKRGAIHTLRGTDICCRGGAQTQDSTPWAPSIFAWGDSLRPTQNNILPPEEYSPSMSPSSTAWTQSPKAARLEEEQLQTSSGSISSSSSGPVNTARVEHIHYLPPSPFATSSSLWEPKLPKPPLPSLPPVIA